MTRYLATLLLAGLPVLTHGNGLIVEGYREPLRSTPSGKPFGSLSRGARVEEIETRGDWVKIQAEGWLWKGSTRRIEQADSARPNGDPPSATQILIPTLLNKGYSDENQHEIVWFDVSFDTSHLPQPTRAIKGNLVISDLFDEPIMRIYWTINDPLTPNQPYVEKGTNFAYNDFLGHHQWVRFTERKDMKVSFEVRNIIYQDGSRQSFYR